MFQIAFEIKLDGPVVTEVKMNTEPLRKDAAIAVVYVEFQKATELKPDAVSGEQSTASGFRKTRQVVSSQKFKYEFYVSAEWDDNVSADRDDNLVSVFHERHFHLLCRRSVRVAFQEDHLI